MPEEERRRLLVEWNATAGELDRDVSVLALFEAQDDAYRESVLPRMRANQDNGKTKTRLEFPAGF